MMNVTLNNFKTGIDTSILKEVSAEILKRAQAKTANVSGNASAFRAVDLGIDLYNVDSKTARQVFINFNRALNNR